MDGFEPRLDVYRRALFSMTVHKELAASNRRGWWPWRNVEAARYHEHVAMLYRLIGECARSPTATCHAGHAIVAKEELDHYTRLAAQHSWTPYIEASMIGLPVKY
jgi:hypothetical protein